MYYLMHDNDVLQPKKNLISSFVKDDADLNVRIEV